MASNGKVLINLATGMEDGEKVEIWATKEAVRLGFPATLKGVACKGCPPLERLWDQFTEAGGELWLCPICVNSRDLGDAERIPHTEIIGATPMWEWAGDDTTVFSY